ncbi:DUF1456 family protein [Ekhidna sp.]|uniref:DUF1456 family protein n=1 Tax=Ekhidna sp. TaxID=2608089 RepID=UPI003CCC2D4A
MNNNDILRRIRYTFNYNDNQVSELFSLGGKEDVTSETVTLWLKKDEDEEQKSLYDVELAAFLNGMIIKLRGKKGDESPKAEKSLNNNIIFRKIKIALNLRDTDIMEIFDIAKFDVSKHEISAIFRNPTQNQYRQCKDQFLRNFLLGLQYKHRNKLKTEGSKKPSED